MTFEQVQKTFLESKHVLANDLDIIKEVAQLITNYENGKRPYYIFCAATGNRLGMSQQPVFEKRLAQYKGNILEMFAKYQGRGNKTPSTDNIQIQATQKKFSPPAEPSDKPIKGIDIIVMPTEFDKEGNPTKYEVIEKDQDDNIVKKTTV